MCSIRELDTLNRQYTALVKPVGPDPEDLEERVRLTDTFHARLAAFLSCFAVRRTVGESFADHQIGPVGRPLRYEVLDCHPPADTTQATSALTAEAKAQVRDFFSRRVKAWQKDDPGKRGPRPKMHDVIGSMARGLPVSSTFRLLAVFATFPAVARLTSTPAFQGWAFTGDDVRSQSGWWQLKSPQKTVGVARARSERVNGHLCRGQRGLRRGWGGRCGVRVVVA